MLHNVTGRKSPTNGDKKRECAEENASDPKVRRVIAVVKNQTLDIH
jgi:hypothetical protein